MNTQNILKLVCISCFMQYSAQSEYAKVANFFNIPYTTLSLFFKIMRDWLRMPLSLFLSDISEKCSQKTINSERRRK